MPSTVMNLLKTEDIGKDLATGLGADRLEGIDLTPERSVVVLVDT